MPQVHGQPRPDRGTWYRTSGLVLNMSAWKEKKREEEKGEAGSAASGSWLEGNSSRKQSPLGASESPRPVHTGASPT